MNISTVARMFGLTPRYLYRCYRNHISDYNRDKESGKWGSGKIYLVDESTGEIISEKNVYIAKPENVGSNMTIDDKRIGNKVYTIVTNAETNKAVFMADTIKKEELKEGLKKCLGESLNEIKTISSDMSITYLNIIQELMPKAISVIDKFHVERYVFEAVQNERNRVKRVEACKLAKSKKKRKKYERASLEDKKKEESIMQNIDLLRRSTYLLNRSEKDWDKEQLKTMEEVFGKFKSLKRVYKLKEEFRNWYDRANIISNIKGFELLSTEDKTKKTQSCKEHLSKRLDKWHTAVGKTNCKEMKAASKMIQTFQEKIINFFLEGASNAKAENINGRIQRFVTNNYGVKDEDFTLYRIANYFS